MSEVSLEKSHSDEYHWTSLTISVNIGSGDGLVPSGTKPLHEPMVTQFYVAIWRHQATNWSQSICQLAYGPDILTTGAPFTDMG